jgi:RNA polymerase sigma-70 factor (ECF subfamily)
MARFPEKELTEEHEMYVSGEPEVYRNMESKDVMALVKQLPVNTSLVFSMHVLEGYKHEEIAQKLGISAGTSKWHLSEARRLLKNKLQVFMNKEFYSHAI